VKWLRDPEDMDHSEEFKDIKLYWFAHKQARNSGNHIKEEVSKQVILSNLVQGRFGPASLEEVQDNFNQEDNIESQFNLCQGWVLCFYTCCT
jgi:hypothetical protein